MTSNLLPAAVGPLMETETNAELAESPRYIRFGSFQIDQQRQQVFRNGTRLKLQGKVYQVLLALIAKHGQVVTREELKHALWPSDTHVNFDANVNTTVNKLRQILGDSPDEPSFIETIPRQGYSFIARVEFADTPPAGSIRPKPLTGAPVANGLETNGDTSVSAPLHHSRWFTAGVV